MSGGLCQAQLHRLRPAKSPGQCLVLWPRWCFVLHGSSTWLRAVKAFLWAEEGRTSALRPVHYSHLCMVRPFNPMRWAARARRRLEPALRLNALQPRAAGVAPGNRKTGRCELRRDQAAGLAVERGYPRNAFPNTSTGKRLLCRRYSSGTRQPSDRPRVEMNLDRSEAGPPKDSSRQISAGPTIRIEMSRPP